MAESVHLYLMINGKPAYGESSKESEHRKNSIECVYYESGILTAPDPGTENVAGSRELTPFLIRKRVDRTTPLLAAAACDSTLVVGEFRFFRSSHTNPDVKKFFSIYFDRGRVASQEFVSPSTLNVGSSSVPPMETVTFIAPRVIWHYHDGNPEHEADWKGKVGEPKTSLEAITMSWPGAKYK